MQKGFVIAIDGPVASGKGTLAAQLAKDLHGFHLYTGAMYRSLALFCIQKSINLENESEVDRALSELDMRFMNGRIMLNNSDITERINEHDVANGASVIGVYPKVREELVRKQQALAEKVCEQGQVVVAEGRDMGTVVFPNSPFRIYLTARPEIRAKRRMEQYLNENTDLEKELENLKKRDKRDQEREVSPLPSQPEKLGYFIVDTTDRSHAETLSTVKEELKKRRLINDSN